MCKHTLCILIGFLIGSGALPAWAAQAAKKPAKSKAPAVAKNEIVLVTVNGKKITETDLNRMFMTRRVRDDQREKARDAFLEEMVDAKLIQQFLESRDTKASKQELDAQVNRIRDAAKQRNSDPDKALAELGYTTESLREEFAIPLAWKHHLDRAVPATRLKAYFDEHRSEFDGTKVKASHIFLKLHRNDDEQAWKDAEAKLSEIRQQILKKEILHSTKQPTNIPRRQAKDDGGRGGIPLCRQAARAILARGVSAQSRPDEPALPQQIRRTPMRRHGPKTGRLEP